MFELLGSIGHVFNTNIGSVWKVVCWSLHGRKQHDGLGECLMWPWGTVRMDPAGVGQCLGGLGQEPKALCLSSGA